MKCNKDNFTTENKKSWSNHKRWCDGLMNRESFVGINLSDKNGMWKGDSVGYIQLHAWVKKRFPKPKFCQTCKFSKPYDLANKGIYDRNLKHWEWLCRRCHMLGDGRMNNLKQYALPELR